MDACVIYVQKFRLICWRCNANSECLAVMYVFHSVPFGVFLPVVLVGKPEGGFGAGAQPI